MKVLGEIAIAVLLFNRAAAGEVVDRIIAKVNDEPIKMSEYEKNKKSVFQQYKKFIPGIFSDNSSVKKLGEKVLDQMIDDMLLGQEAEKLNIKIYPRELDNAIDEIKKRFARDESGKAVDEFKANKMLLDEIESQNMTFEEFRDKIRRQLLVRKLMEQKIKPDIKPPTESELKEYHATLNKLIHKDTSVLSGMEPEKARTMQAAAEKFRELIGERIRLSHIFIKVSEDASFLENNTAFEKAKEIKAKLERPGGDFYELAVKYSDDEESAPKGGDLGYILRDMLPAEIEKKAFEMRVGETAGPIKTKFGYHIIRLQEKKAGQKFRYELAKDDIEQLISSEKFTEKLLDYVKSLRDKADIKTFL